MASKSVKFLSIVLSLGLGGLVSLAGVEPAKGDYFAESDPDDTDGALDIREAVFRHAGTRSPIRSRVLVHGFSTHEAWSNDVLANEGSYISWIFNTDRDRQFERGFVLRLNPDGSLYADLIDGDGHFLGYVRVWRPDDTSMMASIPRKLFDEEHRYRWSVTTEYTSPGSEDCPPAGSDAHPVCRDFVSGVHEL